MGKIDLLLAYQYGRAVGIAIEAARRGDRMLASEFGKLARSRLELCERFSNVES